MLAFLAQIKGLFIPDPFTFTDGNELVEAYNVFNTKGRDDLTNLKKQLLACEFNTVAGRGLIGAIDVQLVLVAWGESLVADAMTAAVATYSEITPAVGTGSPTPSEGTTLLGLINGSTGGGGGDE
jgi:hypothetical protein